MKTTVVYYSLDGNCALIVDMIKTAIQADVLRLQTEDDKHRRGFAKYFWGGRQVLTHQRPALKPYAVNLDSYDLIIFGAPVWAASPAPAINSFLDSAALSNKKVALFCCHGGGMGKAMEKFKALLSGNTIAGVIDFQNPAKQDRQKVQAKLDEWLRKLLD
jgi:flavodoxin